VIHQRFVVVGCFGQCQLEHDLLIVWKRIKLLGDFRRQNVFGSGFVCDGNCHFWFDDRHQSMSKDLFANFELLRNHIGNPGRICSIDHRAHFSAKNTCTDGAFQQRIQIWHWLHHLDAVGFVGQTFVDLQKWDNTAVFPQICGRGFAIDVAVHGHFKQDGADHTITSERRGFGNACAHGVNQVKHFGFGAISIFFDAI